MIEYRIRQVSRWVVTRYEETASSPGRSETKGEYDNADVAYDVAYALCKAEHQALGYQIGDDRIRYPERPAVSSARRADAFANSLVSGA